MDTDERRLWRRQALDLLRPEPEGDPPSRRAVAADVALALVMTVLAVVVAAQTGGDAHKVLIDQDFPAVPDVPDVPLPPEEHRIGEFTGTMPWPLAVMTALPLAVRRRYPLSAFWVILIAAGSDHSDVTWITVVSCLISAYSAMAYSRYRTLATVSLLLAALLAGLAFSDEGPTLPDWSAPFFVLLAAGVIARLVQSWQRRLKDSQRQLAEMESAQAAATRRAVEVERARIAAELHDVVTHNVSVMVIQTGAARKAMDARPDLSRQAMLAVEASGRAAMAELRHVMGLLSASENERLDGLEPQPGLGQLEALVERVRAAGTPVTVTMSLPPDPLPPGVELTAYRVVQEALTNTIKHAPGASAAVRIHHDGDLLEIEVTDTGGVVPGTGNGNGRGLIGLGERLAVYGGTLEARRRPGGGYLVKARVPWRAP